MRRCLERENAFRPANQADCDPFLAAHEASLAHALTRFSRVTVPIAGSSGERRTCEEIRTIGATKTLKIQMIAGTMRFAGPRSTQSSSIRHFFVNGVVSPRILPNNRMQRGGAVLQTLSLEATITNTAS
jgi:hypothetical protein